MANRFMSQSARILMTPIMRMKLIARVLSNSIEMESNNTFMSGQLGQKKRTGYKILRVPFDHSTCKAIAEYEDFVTGFVTPEGNVWGRPVGVTVAKDGSLLFSEDGNRTIWQVSYRK